MHRRVYSFTTCFYFSSQFPSFLSSMGKPLCFQSKMLFQGMIYSSALHWNFLIEPWQKVPNIISKLFVILMNKVMMLLFSLPYARVLRYYSLNPRSPPRPPFLVDFIPHFGRNWWKKIIFRKKWTAIIKNAVKMEGHFSKKTLSSKHTSISPTLIFILL